MLEYPRAPISFMSGPFSIHASTSCTSCLDVSLFERADDCFQLTITLLGAPGCGIILRVRAAITSSCGRGC